MTSSKKSKKAKAAAPDSSANKPRQDGRDPPKVVAAWVGYFGSGDLQDWQRLMTDLGFDEEFKSKTQCRKALRGVWVNIVDFLEDSKAGRPTERFKSERQLSKYTKETKKIYPRKNVIKGSPLASLLAGIF
ncbi:hypothetical protein GGR54DRAFT_280134 [Hypoxylon sp. NC1633]|nr:hypothetical protein GGR54DRAFT_280134 [Hypoxylon sp. NC1633]